MVHTSRSRRRAGLLLVILLAWAPVATAQLPAFGGKFGALGGGLGGSKQEATVSAEFTSPTAERPALLFVTAKIAPGFHMYALDQGQLPDGAGPHGTEIRLAPDSPVKLAGPFRPIEPPNVHVDDVIWKGLELREHEGVKAELRKLEQAVGEGRMTPGAAADRAIEVFLARPRKARD